MTSITFDDSMSDTAWSPDIGTVKHVTCIIELCWKCGLTVSITCALVFLILENDDGPLQHHTQRPSFLQRVWKALWELVERLRWCLAWLPAEASLDTTFNKCTVLQCVRTAFDGASKRGCPKAREDELPAKRGGRQLCLEESFSRKDIVTPEVLRKTCTSSAAVERLFSSAGDILRPKRSSLSNINFEQLVFVRGNMHLLGYKEVHLPHIRRNLLESMHKLVQAMDILSVPYSTTAAQDAAHRFVDITPLEAFLSDDSPMDSILVEETQAVWADEAVQQVFRRGNEYHLMTNAEHFITSASRILHDDYLPSIDDILRMSTGNRPLPGCRRGQSVNPTASLVQVSSTQFIHETYTSAPLLNYPLLHYLVISK
ncbi:Guanine nucleotide-binding protein G(q) subunit alpha [Chionoecetes opilio]|uniref:Guanine nucleotide-binding protein G(Q) subunit alpha n=1 Tax=Chionoecetes opilio TaxID=41210 RepID=A0A8J4XPS7_CHIOP|nr:Guanine nucleotide-binding protein G(q) subunit alpha [Chionoecetes opilio]